MTIKLIGAVIIVLACGWTGFSAAMSFRREERCLEQLEQAVQMMGADLEHELSPLPVLCKRASQWVKGPIAQVFTALEQELTQQVAPDAAICMAAAIEKTPGLPGKAREGLIRLGTGLGRFDLPGQIRGLQVVEAFCRDNLEQMRMGRDQRLRGYQTLGLCAGAALAILFL